MERWFVGLEGIGMYQSLGVMSDEHGQIVASARMSNHPLSLHTTPRSLLKQRLFRLLASLEEKARCRFKDAGELVVCMGLTGVTFGYEGHCVLPRVFEELSKSVTTLVCTGDAEIAFASHALRDSGTAIVCHCGSTAYVVKSGVGYRFGGWGPALGDEGSGFAMGRAALRAVGEEYDRRQPESVLWREVRDWLDRPDPRIQSFQEGKYIWERLVRENRLGSGEDQRTLLYHFSHEFWHKESKEGFELWRRVASGFVVPLMEAWRKGDPAARRIVEQATDDLVGQYREALEVAGVDPLGPRCEPLVLYGGVLRHRRDFRALLLKKLQVSLGRPIHSIMTGDAGTMRPACGALLFALGGSRTGDLRLPPPEVIATVQAQQNRPELRADLKND